jgi:hypothetical protein
MRFMSSPLMHYQESTDRQRLSGHLIRRGLQTGLSTLGAVLFGVPFVGAGVGIILVGMKVVPVEPRSVHAPFWVLTVAGVCFLAAGLFMWGVAVRQFNSNRRRATAGGSGAEAVALADYDWNRRGHQPWRWSRPLRSLGFAVALSVFLSIFNWWAFFSRDGPLMVKVVVSVFDLVLVFLWAHVLLLTARAFRFGDSRIEYTRFPYAVGEPAIIRWQAAGGVGNSIKGTFTLRCVEEWWEVSGSGKNRSRHMIHEQIWSGKWQLEAADDLRSGKMSEFSFVIPPEAKPTNLNSMQPVFWEFEVKLEMAGPDFVESYLVPVYQTNGL